MSPEQPVILAAYINKPLSVLKPNIERHLTNPDSLVYQIFYGEEAEIQALMIPLAEAQRLLGYKPYDYLIDSPQESTDDTGKSESDVLIMDYRNGDEFRTRVCIPIFASDHPDQISEADLVRGMLSEDGFVMPKQPKQQDIAELDEQNAQQYLAEVQAYFEVHQYLKDLYSSLLLKMADFSLDSLDLISNDTLGQEYEAIYFPMFSENNSESPLSESKAEGSKRRIVFPGISDSLLDSYRSLNGKILENSTIISGCIDSVTINVLPAEIKTKLIENLGQINLPISSKNPCLGLFESQNYGGDRNPDVVIEITEFQAEVLAAFARMKVRELTKSALKSLLEGSVHKLNIEIKGKKKKAVGIEDITDALTAIAAQIEKYHGTPADRQDMIQINETDGKIYKLRLPLPAFQANQDTENAA